MGKKIGHGAAPKVPIPAPNVKLFFAEGLIGSAPKPPLPIQLLDIDRFAVPPAKIVLPPIGPDLRNTSKAASLNEFHRVVKVRSEEHTSELQSQSNLVCRLLLEKKTH